MSSDKSSVDGPIYVTHVGFHTIGKFVGRKNDRYIVRCNFLHNNSFSFVILKNYQLAAKPSNYRWSSPEIFKSEIKMGNDNISPNRSPIFFQQLDIVRKNKRPLQIDERLFGNAGRLSYVKSLHNHNNPLKGGNSRQSSGYIKQIPVGFFVFLVVFGYVGGFFLTLWGLNLREEKGAFFGPLLIILGCAAAFLAICLPVAGVAGL